MLDYVVYLKYYFVIVKKNNHERLINMSKICEVCGKKALKAAKISFSHKQNVHRQFPNLQTVKRTINGQTKTIKVCTSCLKANKV